MSITRAEVELAYRLLLGRQPENEAAYDYGLSAGSVETLRRWIMDGFEFADVIKQEVPLGLRRWMLAEERERQEAEQHEGGEGAEEGGPPRIVFIHIMKTAGTSLRRRLEKLLPGEQFWSCDVHGSPGNFPVSALLPYRCFTGHMSFADAWHVPRPRRIFTVLRDPHARIVSLYHYLARHRPEFAAQHQFREAMIARESSLIEFIRNPEPTIRAAVQNNMTSCIAGDYRPIASNLYAPPWGSATDAVSGTKLLRLALENLSRMDFVTSVERLEQDRPRLMAVLGLPDLGPFDQYNTRDFVNAAVEPRPEPEVTEEVKSELNRLTELDRMLVRLAKLDIR